MPAQYVIAVDLADVYASQNRNDFLHTLAWGDFVDVAEVNHDHLLINTTRYVEAKDGSILPETAKGYIWPTKSSGLKPSDLIQARDDSKVLKVNFVDVQQGDGAVVETARGKVVLIDGGDNQMFARYLAARYRGTSVKEPKNIDCIVVTHGDADHFAGLAEIAESERNRNPLKRLFATVDRVYHNGLVKRPSKRPDILGPTRKTAEGKVVTGLVDDLRAFSDGDMNTPFRRWKAALLAWDTRKSIGQVRRLAFGDSAAFSFLKDEQIEVSVLGPFVTDAGGEPGLKWLTDESHTINGHSIVLRLQYGGFSYLFAGDLNEEAEKILVQKHGTELASHIFKVPHHGSADFSPAFLGKVSPLVSVVSSGDDSPEKEYIHPRATLVAALGRYARGETPVVFVTELVAFMKREGWAKLTDPAQSDKRGEFFAFSRAAYGIVKTRTDGKRLLVYTDSGKADLKEAYAFALDDNGEPKPDRIQRA